MFSGVDDLQGIFIDEITSDRHLFAVERFIKRQNVQHEPVLWRLAVEPHLGGELDIG